jgi:hypothetical protein
MSKVVNLTPSILRQIISEEKKKLSKRAKVAKKPTGKSQDVEKVAKQTREVEAKDMAHTLAKEVSHYKDLQKEAAAAAQRLSEINEALQEVRANILEQL